jgi:hypothetical protein
MLGLPYTYLNVFNMCVAVDIPRFLINGSSAVTESTAFLLVEASNPIEKRLHR